jgi:NAD(P)-dependent dehydrogenase (short-subunit alcohol dehydrogenase family)
MGSSNVKQFSLNDVQSQDGKVIIVTGGNIGIGFGTVKGLVSKDATVIMASRSQQRLNESVKEVKKLYPHAKIEGIELDLSKFSSIKKFVETVKRSYLKNISPSKITCADDLLLFSRYSKVDVLINNAGIASNPFAKTEQGFELTYGTFTYLDNICRS